MRSQAKYERIMQILIADIKNGKYKSGEALPSENELMERFLVSRITVRRTMDELYRADYIEKKQGKRAFVKDLPKSQEITKISSYTEEIIKQGMTPFRKVLDASMHICTEEEQKVLGLNKADVVFKLERIIYADKLPFCYTIAILPYKLFMDIETFDYSTSSLYEIIEKKYDFKIHSSELRLKAISSSKVIAKYLDIEKDVPLLYSRAITYGIKDGKEMAIEFFKTYHLTDRFEYTLIQKR